MNILERNIINGGEIVFDKNDLFFIFEFENICFLWVILKLIKIRGGEN